MPSASASNALHRLSADRPRCRLKLVNAFGVGITVTPPASANPVSPARSARAARCSDTSDDEHAVSTVIAGPSSPRT